jgi:hypothetical protein
MPPVGCSQLRVVPFKVDVSLTPSQQVLSLQKRVSDLTYRIDDMQRSYDRLEYKYRCEVLVNSELMDICKTYNLPVRDSLKNLNL